MILTSKIINPYIVPDQQLQMLLSISSGEKEPSDKNEKTCRVEIFNYDATYGIVLDKVFFEDFGQLPKTKVLSIDISQLKPGIYGAEMVMFINSQDINKIKNFPTIEFNTLHLVFQILEKYEDPKISLEEIKRIQTLSHQSNEIGIGKKSEHSKEYIGYAFCQDVYIGKHLNLGKCTISPCERLGNDNIRELMFKYIDPIYGNVKPTPRGNEEPSLDDPYKTPVVVVKYEKIHANTTEEAGTILHNHVNEVLKALSLTNDSYGFILGDILVRRASEQAVVISDRAYFNPYMGNLFVGMENNRKIQQVLKSANDDEIKSFYLQLYIDSSKEKRSKYSYFRFWNLLETIARNHNFVGQPLKDVNNVIVKNRGGIDRRIQDEASEIVFELIRSTYELQNKHFQTEGNLATSTLSDLITIFYQRRNCIAHRGGCQYNNPAICDISKLKMKVCRDALMEMRAKSNNQENFTDEYLFSLRNLTAEIVRYELDYYQ